LHDVDTYTAGRNKKRKQDIARTGTASASIEVVQRYGNANTEFIKAYTGVDNETGQNFQRSLRDVSKYKSGLKQKAGIGGELVAKARANANNKINGSKRTIHSAEDLKGQGYEANDPKTDLVRKAGRSANSKTLENIQVKFTQNPKRIIDGIATEGGEYERYLGLEMQVPTGQVEGLKQHCRDQAKKLLAGAKKARQEGNVEEAKRLEREAGRYKQTASKIKDAGLTQKEAEFAVTNPKLATAREIAFVSHRAGLQGAKYGAAIGGTISAVQNLFVLAQGEKELGEAAKDVVLDTGKAAALGYGTGFAGSAIGGLAKQSKSAYIRVVGKTNLPALVVSTCVSLSGSIKRYVSGEISEAQMLSEIGKTGASMLSSGMFAALGQMVIPIPIVGGVIGGMIGHALSSLFYQSALDSARRVEASREHLQRVREIEAAARAHIAEQQQILDEFVRTEIPQLQQATQAFFSALEEVGDINAFASEANRFAALMGRQLEFHTMEEFDSFMDSDRALTL